MQDISRDLQEINLSLRALADATASGGGGGGGSGTVTSVGLGAPSDLLGVTGSPVTTSGTITLAKVSQAANLFYASPAGAAGVPTFRAMSNADIPSNISRITSIGLSAPSDLLTVGSSPLTANGTISLTKTSQAQGLVYASPAASSGAPTFRALVVSDVPQLPASKTTFDYSWFPAGFPIKSESNRSTTQFATTTDVSFQATGISITYTPLFTNSILLVEFSTAASTAAVNIYADVAIFRDGTNLALGLNGDAHRRLTSPASNTIVTAHITERVTSGSTSPTTFELYLRRAAGVAGSTVSLNRRSTDTVLSGINYITVTEIKQ